MWEWLVENHKQIPPKYRKQYHNFSFHQELEETIMFE